MLLISFESILSLPAHANGVLIYSTFKLNTPLKTGLFPRIQLKYEGGSPVLNAHWCQIDATVLELSWKHGSRRNRVIP